MAFWDRFRAGRSAAPRAATQLDGGVLISTPQELDAYLKGTNRSGSGMSVTPNTAMRVAAVYACVRIIAGAVATLPLQVKRRVDDRTRNDASDTILWNLIRRRPNSWQKPHQFRRMCQAQVMLRGNAYCLKVFNSRQDVQQLIPLNPDKMNVRQNGDLSLTYQYQRPSGDVVEFKQSEIFHLYGMTLDGIRGVTPLTFARETIGLALAMEDHGSSTFRNGARMSGVLKHPEVIGQEAINNLKASFDEYRAGGERDGKVLILEEGMDYQNIQMTAEDAQWIEARKFNRTDIAMFFGVPPHMIGDTEKSTSWGSGIEQQSLGFIAYTLEDHLTMWEEGITADLSNDPKIYAHFTRAALVKGDIKTRMEAYAKGLQWGIWSPNEVRAHEDENPREGGDEYYDPPNTAGGSQTRSDNSKDAGNDPPQNA